VNPEAGDTLARAVAEVNALPLQPDFIVLTGDLTHATDDPHERRRRMLAWLARDLTALDKDPPPVVALTKDAPVVALTHRPPFDLAPQWDWATRHGVAGFALAQHAVTGA